MGQWLVVWTDIILRKTKVHVRYKSMALEIETQEEATQRRPDMEPRSMLTLIVHLKYLLVRKLTFPRNCLAVRLVHLFRGEEKGENELRAMALKILRKPSHPLFMGILRRGKKHNLGYLA
jgi:hypothetical protein